MLRAAARVCTLSPGDSAARLVVMRDLLRRASVVASTPDGVRLDFERTDANRVAVHAFVDAESECCARFRYEVSDASEHALSLHIAAERGDVADLRTLYLDGDRG